MLAALVLSCPHATKGVSALRECSNNFDLWVSSILVRSFAPMVSCSYTWLLLLWTGTQYVGTSLGYMKSYLVLQEENKAHLPKEHFIHLPCHLYASEWHQFCKQLVLRVLYCLLTLYLVSQVSTLGDVFVINASKQWWSFTPWDWLSRAQGNALYVDSLCSAEKKLVISPFSPSILQNFDKICHPFKNGNREVC